MSLERVLETLASFRLKSSDARIYVYLAKQGPRTGKDLSAVLGMAKAQLYPCLENLKNKQLVTATSQRPALFSAVPFEKALELLIENKIEEAKRDQASIGQAMLYWEKMLREDSDSPPELQTNGEELKKRMAK